jgi:hypothetical protein
VAQFGPRHSGSAVGCVDPYTLQAKSCGSLLLLLYCLCRKFIDVLPLEGDWSPEYRVKVQAMVQARNQIRKDLLGYVAQFGKKL